MKGTLFYDGDCGLCNWSVQFLSRHDSEGRLRFEPLQGEAAAHALPKSLRTELSTAVYQRTGGARYLRSAAVLYALMDTGSRLRVLARVALYLPACLRDPVYNWVAHNRDRCELPRHTDS